MAPLTLRPELDRMRCATEGCTCVDELVIESLCHPRSPAWATYAKGELALECAECGETIITVAVAG